MINQNNKKGLEFVKWAVAFALGLGLAVAVLFVKNFWTETDVSERLRFLSDACTVPAILFICIGALVWLSNNDAFLGLGYLAKFAINAIIPLSGLKKGERYAEYRERMQSREKKTGYAFLFVIGGIFFVATIIFLLLWNNSL